MRSDTTLDVFRPETKNSALLYDLVLILGATIAIALSAQIAIPVPFSPVPITGQTLAVLLTGTLLGRRRGTLAVILYLLEGSLGLPVFAQAKFGLIHLYGPTGGYLAGFIPAVYVSGYLAERGWDRTIPGAALIFTLGTIIIFVSGLAWLMHFTSYTFLLEAGFIPFIPGAMIKIAAATLLAPFLRHFLSPDKNQPTDH